MSASLAGGHRAHDTCAKIPWMIARARVLLPKTLLVPLEDEPDPVDLDLGAYRAKLFRPYRSELAEVTEELPLSERPGLLRRAESPTQPLIRMNEEQVVAADVIQVDFSAEDFDRRLGASNDPPVSLLFEVVNGFLARYRTLARGFQITALAPTNTMWRIEYLNDDGSDLEPQQGLARALVGASFTVELMGLPRTGCGTDSRACAKHEIHSSTMGSPSSTESRLPPRVLPNFSSWPGRSSTGWMNSCQKHFAGLATTSRCDSKPTRSS